MKFKHLVITTILLFSLACTDDENTSVKIKEISIYSPPLKTIYYLGETLDYSGLFIKITYENGEFKNIAPENFGINGIMCSHANNIDIDTVFSQILFTHSESGKSTTQNIEVLTEIKDIDNNSYKFVKIGRKLWMAENLNTTHFANGDIINDGTGMGNISGLNSPEFWFVYNDNNENASTYGKLYTWYTVNDVRNICPDGWHVPTNDEWLEMINYAGGKSYAGANLKDTGTTYWDYPNTGASNYYGFTALPAGTRSPEGIYNFLGGYTHWWTKSEYYYDGFQAYYLTLFYCNTEVWNYIHNKKGGFSVRCIKD